MIKGEIYNESIKVIYTTWLSWTVKNKNGRQSEEQVSSENEPFHIKQLLDRRNKYVENMNNII